MATAYCLLPIAYCLLPIAYCPLLCFSLGMELPCSGHGAAWCVMAMIAHLELVIAHLGLQPRIAIYIIAYIIAYCHLPIAICLLPWTERAICLLPIAICLLPFAYCLLPFAYCLKE